MKKHIIKNKVEKKEINKLLMLLGIGTLGLILKGDDYFNHFMSGISGISFVSALFKGIQIRHEQKLDMIEKKYSDPRVDQIFLMYDKYTNNVVELFKDN